MRRLVWIVAGFMPLLGAASAQEASPYPFTSGIPHGVGVARSGDELLPLPQPDDYAFITPAFSAAARTSFSDPAMPGRSARDAAIYRGASPSVVLIFAADGLGSGVIISEDRILTNWHVIAGETKVGVVFKPETEGAMPGPEDMRKGIVVKWDEVADLALIEVADIPAGREPIPMGDLDTVAVGLDVHAIGHPDGQQWTYTKGIISQVPHRLRMDLSGRYPCAPRQCYPDADTDQPRQFRRTLAG